MSLNKAFFCGRVCRKPELKQVESAGGKKFTVANVDIAVDEGFGDKKQVNYFHLTAVGKTADLVGQYWDKGTKVIVECKPKQSRWKNKDGYNAERVEFNIISWEFAESKAAQNRAETPPPAPDHSAGGGSWMDIPDSAGSELPFV